MRWSLCAGWALVACGLDEERFATASARTHCARMKECAEDDLIDVYGDKKACVDALSSYNTSVTLASRTEASCTFDVEVAAQCLRAEDKADCDGWDARTYQATCDAVWLCPA